MSSSPAPEFDTFIRNLIASHARTIFAGVPPAETQSLFFTVYTNFIAKEGALPASKSAIEALPTVTVTEEEESDCAICLTEHGVAGEVKELPCKHRYHSDCIVKWLEIHGSCPVCRYEMPVDEEEKRRRDGGAGWQVVITVTSGDPVNETGSDSVESNGQSIENMDIDQDSSMEELD
ncbi:hypothetical protein E3N88_30234 [Mikania micrantha]|uniref:RING-type E3 ubiquitin transferase n=1 Tax=Mikania micrantha TaxID=192012 RepID=A0A5N6ML05_9ASTR|nr:hypothetical protein E3N88_30234 [Mikania micrantha]